MENYWIINPEKHLENLERVKWVFFCEWLLKYNKNIKSQAFIQWWMSVRNKIFQWILEDVEEMKSEILHKKAQKENKSL